MEKLSSCLSDFDRWYTYSHKGWIVTTSIYDKMEVCGNMIVLKSDDGDFMPTTKMLIKNNVDSVQLKELSEYVTAINIEYGEDSMLLYGCKKNKKLSKAT